MLVDDHMVMRMGLMTATGDQPDMEVVAEVESGNEAVACWDKVRPDVVVLDLRMTGLSGIETIQALRQKDSAVRILIFSNYVRGEEVYQVMRAGAAGFVSKEMPLERLLTAIRCVYRGENYIPPEVAQRLGERLPAHLSEREMEVLRHIAKGMSNKEIGSALSVVEGTVKIHVANILAKLGAADRTQAVVLAVRRGLLQID